MVEQRAMNKYLAFDEAFIIFVLELYYVMVSIVLLQLWVRVLSVAVFQVYLQFCTEPLLLKLVVFPSNRSDFWNFFITYIVVLKLDSNVSLELDRSGLELFLLKIKSKASLQ